MTEAGARCGVSRAPASPYRRAVRLSARRYGDLWWTCGDLPLRPCLRGRAGGVRGA
ncbi:hypothetical protein [Streptomyces peucetius]|uniref:Uncharacterized protein n=1 Tax=Streptomyces peucetius TaxID=1950 RepID=A0ABY6IDW9_STRPE|nr:hypothetical protein [Streptomyces peucetius]UYQ63925.1 hypothetical protein OGH68_22310 [Streptomyces peucetius]